MAGESVDDSGELGGRLKVPDAVSEHDEVVGRRSRCEFSEVGDDVGVMEGDAGAEGPGAEM